MVNMDNELTIAIWDGCDPIVSEAIQQFQNRWGPYSRSSRGRYPIVRLIEELIDPAVAAYAATLPAGHPDYIPGAGTGMPFSEMIRRSRLNATVRVQRQLLRAFVLTKDRQSPADQQFIATLESLIELVWACERKRPKNKPIPGRAQNGQRVRGYCRFCGRLAELTMLASGDETPKADDEDDEFYLSSLYCVKHRPKFQGNNSTGLQPGKRGNKWNSAYKRARRSVAQFNVELARLTRQFAIRREGGAKSGDSLIDNYFFHYALLQTLHSADEAELRNQARQMVDSRLTDRKKQMLALRRSGLNQSEIARKLGIARQAVSKALASIPPEFRLN